MNHYSESAHWNIPLGITQAHKSQYGTKFLSEFLMSRLRCASPDTSLLWFVDRLVSLDEDDCPFAVHCHSGAIVEDVAPLSQVAVPPDLQLGLAS